MMPHRTPFGARVLTGCPVYLSAGGTSHSAVLLTQIGHGQHGSPLCCLQMGPDTRRFPDMWENLVQKTETRTDASPLATTCSLSFLQGIYNLKSHRLFLTNAIPTVLLFPCLTYDSLTVAGSQASRGVRTAPPAFTLSVTAVCTDSDRKPEKMAVTVTGNTILTEASGFLARQLITTRNLFLSSQNRSIFTSI